MVIAAEQAFRGLGFNDYFISDGVLSKLRRAVRDAMTADQARSRSKPGVLFPTIDLVGTIRHEHHTRRAG